MNNSTNQREDEGREWKVEYDNHENGSEWWSIFNDETVFKAYNQGAANKLCDLLKQSSSPVEHWICFSI